MNEIVICNEYVYSDKVSGGTLETLPRTDVISVLAKHDRLGAGNSVNHVNSG